MQPELVVKIEFVLIERKQSCRFRHNSIICQKDMKGFSYVDTVPRSKVMQSKNRKTPSKDDPRNFSPIRAFFLSSYRVNIARCNLCARAKVKGHIKLKIEENTSVGKLVEPFQIW